MRGVVVALAVGVLSTFCALIAQTSPLVATWKVNLAKSTFSPGPPPSPSQTLTWRAVDGDLEFTVTGVGADGKPTKETSLEKADGSYSPFQGAAPGAMRRMKRIDEHTYEGEEVNGKATITRNFVVSPDGRTLTLTATGVNQRGQQVNNVAVYDKQ